jgi:hypothetical protein
MSEKEKALKIFYKNFASFGDFLGTFYSATNGFRDFSIILKHKKEELNFRVFYANLSIQYQKQNKKWEEIFSANDI